MRIESVALAPEASDAAEKTVMSILLAISFSHMLNDTIQSLISAIYPVVKESFHLSFAQIGLITLSFQLTASLLQPVVGFYTDRRPLPYSLAAGMCFTLVGLVLLSTAGSYAVLLVSVALVGMGSSVFHPEASRLAYMAAGGRHGFAQALFQVGGNTGSALGPLLAAMIVVGERAQARVLWFSTAAVAAIAVLWNVGHWYRKNTFRLKPRRRSQGQAGHAALPPRKVGWSIAILVALIFSKYFYLASMGSYYTFYLIAKFHLSIQSAQLYLFMFLFSVAAGTLIGGPVGDRFGRKYVIWVSILGVAPFTLLLPHAGLFWTAALSVVIGLVLSSAFSAILVYAQELLPGKVGLIAGLFFGLAFGMGGLGSAVLGHLADVTSIGFVFQVCAFLPLLGLLTGFLPNLEAASAKGTTINLENES
jgi:FSR family fosmidomycin resistance protein-like MFS transporter